MERPKLVHRKVMAARAPMVATAREARAPMAATAREAFSEIYRSHTWQFGDSAVPLSGGGSSLEATNTTCAVLLHAVLMVARAKIKHVPHHVRILDLPCGDFTWIPQCLRDVASHAPPETPLRLVYRGVDVVGPLIEQLNSRAGDLIQVPASHFEMPATVRILPFVRADVSNATELSALRGQVDIIVSKHMLIHTPNSQINDTLRAWETLGATYLLRENTRTPSLRTLDIHMGGGHDVDLHGKQFNIGPPLCRDFDAGICAAQGKCQDSIELYDMTSGFEHRKVGSPAERDAMLAKVPSCIVDAHEPPEM